MEVRLPDIFLHREALVIKTQVPRKKAGFNYERPWTPWLYLLPHGFFFLLFIIFPVLFGAYISVVRWDPLRDSIPFVGLEHYVNLMTKGSPQNEFFWRSLGNTVLFVVVTVPLLIGTSLGLAALVYKRIPGRNVFRSFIFLPGILAVSVVGILWRWMFDNQAGLVNVILTEGFGLSAIPWITTEWAAWVPIILSTLWWTVGFNMTIYLAAMGNIPASVYEAAELDGAGEWKRFVHITCPMLSETTLFVTVTTILASFQLFGQPLMITNGGPTRTTQSVIMYITEEAFGNNQYSSAAAMAFVFGFIMLIFTAAEFRTTIHNAKGGGV
ncbi:MAG: sugar ABC transporter permease [Rectinemataceae bacterium]